jgi:hypothetical protein
VLAAPLIGIVCEAIAPRLALALAGALIVSMAPWVLNNTARPLLGPHSVLSSSRNDQYFAFQPDLEPAYAGGLAYIADQGCTHIGFISNQDGWEYPVWALSPGPIEIEDAAVTNVSADASAARFRPCAVFTIGAASTSPSLALDGQSFARTWIQDDIAVFVPDGSS